VRGGGLRLRRRRARRHLWSTTAAGEEAEVTFFLRFLFSLSLSLSPAFSSLYFFFSFCSAKSSTRHRPAFESCSSSSSSCRFCCHRCFPQSRRHHQKEKEDQESGGGGDGEEALDPAAAEQEPREEAQGGVCAAGAARVEREWRESGREEEGVGRERVFLLPPLPLFPTFARGRTFPSPLRKGTREQRED